MVHLSVDVAPLDGHEPGEGVDDFEDKVGRGIRVIQKSVELDAEEVYFRD